MSGYPFIPPRDARFYLLQAHRQPLPENIAAHFIEAFTGPGDLIVDPFVGSDAIVRAALERGRRILTADSNPLVAWATRLQATLPGAREISGALGRLADTRKEGEPLRAALEKLYASQCANCGGPVIVDYFLRRLLETRTPEGESALPSEKIYTCPACGTRRDDATETDRQRARDAAPHGLSYHVLVQRLIADDPANTPALKHMLELYTPRNLNALAALTQKLDADFKDDAARPLLAAMMLHALDVGTSLYPAPGAMPMREIPDEFVEVNIWRALETAAQGLSERPPALRLASSPARVLRSETPAAFIGQGGARFLTEHAAEARAALILSSPARLDPGFWELSFLWARWLLGKTAAAPLEPLLDEKRQRWSWYGDALTNALAETAALAAQDARFVVAFPSGSHAMVEALLLAGAPVFALDEFAFRPERGASRTTEWGALRGDYQLIWKRADAQVTPAPMNVLSSKIRAASLAGAREILAARREPLSYSWVHHSGLQNLARENLLAVTIAAKYREGENAFQFLRHRMEQGFKEGYIQELDHWEEKDRVLWMRREESVEPETGPDFGTRVESVVREVLPPNGAIAADALEDAVLAQLGGLLTPEVELVEMCARAHADFNNGAWTRRRVDAAQWRADALHLVRRLGAHLGFQVVEDAGEFDLIWRIEKIIPGSASGSVPAEQVSEDAYAFLVRAQVDFGELLAVRTAPLQGLVVLPESLVELTLERLRREPRRLKKLERAGLGFLRLPMMELLLNEAVATTPEFQLAWGLEPPLTQGQEQLQLL
jgi:hypothetical protein